MTDDAQSKKIIVDEDWKGQVEAEREKLRQQKEAPAAGEQKAESGSAPAAEKASPGAEAEPPLPPPDLLFLASTLYMQALVALGVIAHPMNGESKLHLPQAKHAIDTLQMLQEKTAGNRTAEESEAIEHMLHELRLAYVGVQAQQAKG
jgi:hypothetical protein